MSQQRAAAGLAKRRVRRGDRADHGREGAVRQGRQPHRHRDGHGDAGRRHPRRAPPPRRWRGSRRCGRAASSSGRAATSPPAMPASSPTAPPAQILMDRETAEAEGKEILGIYRGFQVAGCEPDEMGIGPVFAIPKLLDRAGLSVADIGLWEINEAFAVAMPLLPRHARHRSREAQRQWRRDRGRASVRHDRIAAGRPCADRGPQARRALCRRVDVHRRRHGRGGAVRNRLARRFSAAKSSQKAKRPAGGATAPTDDAALPRRCLCPGGDCIRANARCDIRPAGTCAVRIPALATERTEKGRGLLPGPFLSSSLCGPGRLDPWPTRQSPRLSSVGFDGIAAGPPADRNES